MELTERRTPKCLSLPTSLLDQLDELPRRSVSRWVEETIRERLNRNTAEESGRQDKHFQRLQTKNPTPKLYEGSGNWGNPYTTVCGKQLSVVQFGTQKSRFGESSFFELKSRKPDSRKSRRSEMINY